MPKADFRTCRKKEGESGGHQLSQAGEGDPKQAPWSSRQSDSSRKTLFLSLCPPFPTQPQIYLHFTEHRAPSHQGGPFKLQIRLSSLHSNLVPHCHHREVHRMSGPRPKVLVDISSCPKIFVGSPLDLVSLLFQVLMNFPGGKLYHHLFWATLVDDTQLPRPPFGPRP
ncbi:hypothetical protein GHT09_003883 [Marmota monax]|uniref:Uncharacterized protein n=1 Tax=Marmota monax TaxID=9995 RepID=A0A834UPE3_MARMO|nr:hypothetical protein GHT09_003883 [Marmota monax]